MERRAPGTVASRPGQRKGWIAEQSVFWFRLGVLLIGWLLRYWIRCYRVWDVDKFPAEGGVFLIGNHTSALDPFFLAYPIQHRMPHGPGKIELFNNPFSGFLMRKIGIFPIRQHSADASAVRAMVQLYRAGEVVIVYPEGGRSPSGELQPFFPDFARLAIRLKARLVPAGMAGPRDVLPMGSLIPRPNTPVAVVFGDAFELSQFYGREITAQVAAEAAEVMHSRVAELVQLAAMERQKLSIRF